MKPATPLPVPARDQAPPVSRTWRPGKLLYGAGLVHAGAAVAVLADPSTLAWAAAAVGATHATLATVGLWPRSTWLGPNALRLPRAAGNSVALTFDDGPHPELTPRVLELLDRHGARATFFCVGERAARYPGLVREIARRGHAVENHSMHHRLDFSVFGPWRMRREIRDAQQLLADLTGQPPRYFRAPAGLRNPFLEPVLCTEGLQLAAWTRRGFDTRNGDRAARIAQRLTHNLAAGDILLLHDGNSGVDPAGKPHCTAVLPGLLAAIADAGLQCVTLRAGMAAEAGRTA
ncbi:polysaccharide deacetylase family protein [Cupriavidus sp. WKF15]|uniref:polysaccharide deacetylase family protein n=1 Tax=Cupriavidus sp. WKF15 TaxID=3032282 RepID=UPI0023E1E35E|nr:polysaccharide deacetylase family protein [Cupriavidus sp. WKF15]WER48169.1 polysaccharide deacetylase family protein [Cupriavidus sp. WKF15]